MWLELSIITGYCLTLQSIKLSMRSSTPQNKSSIYEISTPEGTNKMKEDVSQMFITCTLGSLTSLSQYTYMG